MRALKEKNQLGQRKLKNAIKKAVEPITSSTTATLFQVPLLNQRTSFYAREIKKAGGLQTNQDNVKVVNNIATSKIIKLKSKIKHKGNL